MIDQERRIKSLQTEVTLKTKETTKSKAQPKELTEEVESLKQVMREDRQQ